MTRQLTLFLAAALLATAAVAADDEREILYWYDPMVPDTHFDEPGRSPFMDMDLVPMYADEAGDDTGPAVRVAPGVLQNMNVRMARATRGPLPHSVHAFGEIDYDETRLAQVNTRVEGWIERLEVRAAGEPVQRGDLLFELYSPTLVNAQEELLQAVRGGRAAMAEAARERLRALGVSSAQIRQIEQSGQARQRIGIHAPRDGIVAALNARDGMYVTPGTEVLRIADLSSVWLIAALFPHQAAWVSEGDTVSVTLPGAPDILTGVIDYLYPTLDPVTRTVRARVRLDNAGGHLRPGDYARVHVEAAPREDVLTVPAEAVIRTGRMDRVIVHLGEGRFRAHEVRPGLASDERIEIVEGLEKGMEVVVSGQFLIDSEARARTAVARLGTAEDTGHEDRRESHDGPADMHHHH